MSCFQAFEYVLTRAQRQLVDRERSGNERQSLNSDDQFDFSLSLHTSKRLIERYSRKFTSNKVLKAYQSNPLRISCLKRPDSIRNGAWHATSFPGFSLLLRERTLVATGHEEMCVNKLEVGPRIGPPINFVGENSCFKPGA